ncbi:hypothetical protein M0802_009821 [Mischocyttarus mexicanus]|nr:hypothetical protein M0802_009821 [Mischocyttarus mexicanus]
MNGEYETKAFLSNDPRCHTIVVVLTLLVVVVVMLVVGSGGDVGGDGGDGSGGSGNYVDGDGSGGGGGGGDGERRGFCHLNRGPEMSLLFLRELCVTSSSAYSRQ